MKVLDAVSIKYGLDGKDNVIIIERDNGDYFFSVYSLGTFQIPKELLFNGIKELEIKSNMRKVLTEKCKSNTHIINLFYKEIETINTLRLKK